MTISGFARAVQVKRNTLWLRDLMKKTLSVTKKLCLVLLGIAAGACVMEPLDEGAELAETGSKEQPVSSWRMYGEGKNFKSFDVGTGWGCFEHPDSSGNFTIYCALPGESLGPRIAAATWMGNLPNGIKGPSSSKARAKSIAVSVPVMGVATLYVLGKDNVVRSSSSRLEMNKPWLERKAFQSFDVTVKAQTTSGSPLVIKEIVSVGLPSHSGASQLIALASDGFIYLKTGNQWRRVDANSPAPFNSIPANNKFREISRGGKLGGYLLDDATSRVFLVGAGTYDHQNYIAHYDNRWLPPLPNGLLATHVGGPFVLTNTGNGSCSVGATSCPGDDRRVFQYNFSTNTWVKPSGALVPSPGLTPGAPDDPYSTTPPWKGIADGTGFTASGGYFVWHFYTRVYEAIP